MGEDGKHAGERKQLSFSSRIVVASVCATVAYTAASFALDFHDSALTAAWFAFWTVELVSLASIKKDKIRNKYESEGR